MEHGQLGSRIQLDGAWSFKAQIDALRACNQEDAAGRRAAGGSCQGDSGERQEDFTFRENSVKEVTDRGRTEVGWSNSKL